MVRVVQDGARATCDGNNFGWVGGTERLVVMFEFITFEWVFFPKKKIKPSSCLTSQHLQSKPLPRSAGSKINQIAGGEKLNETRW